MTPDVSSRGWTRYLPPLDTPLWRVLFAASVMVNLLVGGMMLGNRFGPGRFDRVYSPSIIQVVPRHFIQALPRQRRLDLMRDVRPGMDDLRDVREGTSETVLALAAALEQDTLDLGAVRIAVQNFATGPDSSAAKGASVVVGLIDKLTPDERKGMAAAIRDRATKNRERGKFRKEAK
jgi:hypothetical protein